MCLSVYVSVCMCVSLTRRNTFFLQVLEDTYHMRQPITPLTSDTPRLRQHVLRSPVARRHANALPTKAAQIPMALRHHERTLATRSVHTLEANISLDTANDPAHQRHAAFTPACFALPSGTAPRKRTFHQGRANPHGIATQLFPALHLYYKLATSESSSERLFPVLHLYYKLATSESSSKNARTGQIALSPPFRALDTHDLRRGLRAERANSTLG